MVKILKNISKTLMNTRLKGSGASEGAQEVYMANLWASNTDTVTGTESEQAVTPAGLTAKTASDAEALAETLTTKFLTPKNLAALGGTTDYAGMVMIGSDSDALAETSKVLALCPSNLAALGGTATFAGLVEIATDAEAVTGTDTARAITAANLRAVLANLRIIPFTGHNEAGACTATGATTDAVVLCVGDITNGGLQATSDFETAITVADQIQQSATDDLSSVNLIMLIAPVEAAEA